MKLSIEDEIPLETKLKNASDDKVVNMLDLNTEKARDNATIDSKSEHDTLALWQIIESRRKPVKTLNFGNFQIHEQRNFHT